MPLIAGKDEIPSGKKAGYTWGNGHMKGVCTGTAAKQMFRIQIQNRSSRLIRYR